MCRHDPIRNECAVCQSTSSRTFCFKRGMTYLVCAECGHVYLKSSEQAFVDLRKFYADGDHHYRSNEKIDWDYSTLKTEYYYKPLLNRIRSLHQRGRLLDIGCANGSFLYAAKKAGWETTGIELNRTTSQIARDHGLDVYGQDLHDIHFPNHDFSAVTMWSVLEHMPDIPLLLNEISRILRPGGILAVAVPNIKSLAWHLLKDDWDCVDPPVHLHLFTVASLRRLVRKYGFQYERIETLDLKPSTLKDIWKKTFHRDQEIMKSLNSMALMVQKSSQKRMLWMLRFRRVLNVPLSILGLGEDIYGYFRKM